MIAQLSRALAVVLVLTLVLPLDASAAVRHGPADHTTGRWIVTLAPDADAHREAPGLARRHGGRVDYVYEHVLNGFSFSGSAAAAAAISRNPHVLNVVKDHPVQIVAETLPWGIRRVDAHHPTDEDAHESGFTGEGVSIGILDTGVDLDHPDLHVDVSRGINCVNPALPPDDGHGHGTHVAGTAAALLNGIGVVGVAPGATIVPIKVLDDTGVGTDATVICGVDHLVGLMSDANESNDVVVANMSFGEEGGPGNCADGGLRQAICNAVAAGVTFIAAAGNSTIDVAGFRPANFPEVITVSAMTDLDGEPGGAAGCTIIFICDDSLAFFSNFGSGIDVIAPGFQVNSTWKGGTYRTSDGTSMAAPHVAGIAALVKAANPDLDPAAVEDLVRTQAECPDGTEVAAGQGATDCIGQGSWPGDPDGTAEPAANALLAARAANDPDLDPSVAFVSPVDGATVTGALTLEASASDDFGVSKVAFYVNGVLLGEDTDPHGGWSVPWDTSAISAGLLQPAC